MVMKPLKKAFAGTSAKRAVLVKLDLNKKVPALVMIDEAFRVRVLYNLMYPLSDRLLVLLLVRL